MVDQLAEPDVAWWYRNNRPGPITEHSVSEGYWRPERETTVFFPSADVRGFYLPEPSWELLSATLLVQFRARCEWRCTLSETEPLSRWVVENRVGFISASAWAIELLEHRESVDPQPMQELRMHWGRWFSLLLKQLNLAAYDCPPGLLAEYVAAVLNLRSQCSPANQHFLTGTEAQSTIAATVAEIRDSNSYQERFGI